MQSIAKVNQTRDSSRCLVVDDDPIVLKYVSGLLDKQHNVITAISGKEALLKSRDYAPEIHLLLSDFQMPGMGGIDLATALSLERPNIRVLLMSGFDAGMLVLNEGGIFWPNRSCPHNCAP